MKPWMAIGLAACGLAAFAQTPPAKQTKAGVGTVTHTEREWNRILTPAQYYVLRDKGTETAYTGAYWNNHQPGSYVCAGCGLELFRSDTKFDSGTGWPSFWAPVDRTHVVLRPDNSDGMQRTEVLCARCGGHLGHVFDDGPKPTGLRYCMNSVSLRFIKQEPKRK